MRKALKIMALLFVVAILAMACTQNMVPETPKEVYLKANMTFNGLLSDYISQKTMAPAETKAKWTQQIDPLFEKAGVALKAWGTALKGGAPTANTQQRYLELKNQLLAVMLKELAN